jgi:DNA-binding CsgD family transcriptional regulator
MKLQAILDDLDKQIIELLCEGKAPKEIAHKLWKSKGCIHQRLHTLRKYYSCDTTYQLIAKLKEVA